MTVLDLALLDVDGFFVDGNHQEQGRPEASVKATPSFLGCNLAHSMQEASIGAASEGATQVTGPEGTSRFCHEATRPLELQTSLDHPDGVGQDRDLHAPANDCSCGNSACLLFPVAS